MIWFRDLKTFVKIISLVVLMALFIGGVGFIGYYYNQKSNQAMTHMYEKRLISVKVLNDARNQTRAVEAITMEVLLAPLDIVTEGLLVRAMTSRAEDFDKLWAIYAATVLDPYEAERVPIITEAMETYRTERTKAINIAQTGNKEEAYHYFQANVLNSLDELNINLAELANYNDEVAAELSAQGNIDFARATKIILAFPLIAIVISVILGYFISRMISNPLIKMLTIVQEVAEGNLSITMINVRSKDEVGQLSTAFNIMTNNLRNLALKVSESSDQVAASSQELLAITDQNAKASTQIAAAITEVATGSESQASTVTETASAIEQLSVSTQQVADMSSKVALLTDKTALTVDKGQNAIDKVIGQMNSISKNTEQVQQTVQQLAASSEQINQIIDVITGITDQTNLLALNAAIEAARAGEHGRGFAVVAEEVRKLAEQSRVAAQQILELIQDNGKNINEAMSAMNDEINDVKAGIDVVDTAGKSFQEITDLVRQVYSQVQEISATTEEMASGTEQIVSSVQEVDRICNNTAILAQTVSATIEEQTASLDQISFSSQSLASMAQNLQNAVKTFKLSR